jgi:uncharacterized protein DUF1302
MGKMKRLGFWLRILRRHAFIPPVIFAIYLVPLVFCENGQAFQARLGDDTTIDIDVTLKYAVSMRVADQDNDLLADINGDDGNRNFDQWDLISNRPSAIIDIDAQYKNVGFFLRPRAFFDFAYDESNANDSPATNNNGPLYGGPLSKNDEFSHQTEDTHRDQMEILDAYVYGTFDLGERDLVLRVGRQVVSWGESLFIPNGISSAQSHVDITQSNTPGAELKELFLPVGQVYSQLDLWRNLTLAGFYQWEWKKSILDEAGSFFSTSDFLDDAGRRILIPVALEAGLAATIDRAADHDADDSGQWGVSLRYIAERLSDTEFGLYFINYHEKTPMVMWQPFGGSAPMDWTLIAGPPGGFLNMLDASSYFLSYAEDIKLYGFSIGTEIADINFGIDVSYRQDFPVTVHDAMQPLGFSYREADILQTQMSWMYIAGPGPMSLWRNATFMGEVGFNSVSGIDDSELEKDDFAWGGTVQMIFSYFSVMLPKLDLNVPVSYKFNPDGTSPVIGTFSEGADSVSLGLDFTYNVLYKFGLKYTAFIGSASDNNKTDRDFIGFNFTYTF